MKAFQDFVSVYGAISVLLFGCIFFCACDLSIASFTYDTENIKIPNKAKITVDNKPAVKILIENIGDSPVEDVTITVKAKKNQVDLQIIQLSIKVLEAHSSVERVALFDTLESHEDYDFMTFAIAVGG